SNTTDVAVGLTGIPVLEGLASVADSFHTRTFFRLRLRWVKTAAHSWLGERATLIGTTPSGIPIALIRPPFPFQNVTESEFHVTIRASSALIVAPTTLTPTSRTRSSLLRFQRVAGPVPCGAGTVTAMRPTLPVAADASEPIFESGTRRTVLPVCRLQSSNVPWFG